MTVICKFKFVLIIWIHKLVKFGLSGNLEVRKSLKKPNCRVTVKKLISTKEFITDFTKEHQILPIPKTHSRRIPCLECT